jgi:hypothetical protein
LTLFFSALQQMRPLRMHALVSMPPAVPAQVRPACVLDSPLALAPARQVTFFSSLGFIHFFWSEVRDLILGNGGHTISLSSLPPSLS